MAEASYIKNPKVTVTFLACISFIVTANDISRVRALNCLESMVRLKSGSKVLTPAMKG